MTNVTSNMTITDNFVPTEHTLTIATDGSGTGTITPPEGDYIYDYGIVVDLNAVPGVNSVFSEWTGDVADPGSATTTVTMDSDKTVTATFLLDGDNDGVADVDESGPSGTDPDYDRNGDGTPDSGQDNVASFPTFDGNKYVTLEVLDPAKLSDVKAVDNPSPGDAPGDAEFKHGFFEFTITGVGVGGSVDMTMYLDEKPNAFYKYGPTPLNTDDHWYEFAFDNTTGAEFKSSVVTLHFVDGERGDSDAVAGSITDPGAPSFASSSGSGGGCFIAASSGQTSPLKSAPMALVLVLALCLATELLAYISRR